MRPNRRVVIGQKEFHEPAVCRAIVKIAARQSILDVKPADKGLSISLVKDSQGSLSADVRRGVPLGFTANLRQAGARSRQRLWVAREALRNLG